MVRKAEFSLDSALEKPLADFSLDDLNLSLGFRSTKSDGILLQNSKNVCILSTIAYTIWSKAFVYTVLINGFGFQNFFAFDLFSKICRTKANINKTLVSCINIAIVCLEN